MRTSAKNVVGAVGGCVAVVATFGIQPAGQSNAPMDTAADYECALETLSNWGRWGDDDELGAASSPRPNAGRQPGSSRRGSACRWRTTLSRRSLPMRPHI